MKNELIIPEERIVLPTFDQVKWLDKTRSVSLSLDLLNFYPKDSIFVACNRLNALKNERRAPTIYWFKGQVGNGLRIVFSTNENGNAIFQPYNFSSSFGAEFLEPGRVNYLEISLGERHPRFGREIQTREIYL